MNTMQVPSQLGHHDFWLHYMYRREELRVRMQQREKLKQRAETVPVNADHPTVDWDGVINARVFN